MRAYKKTQEKHRGKQPRCVVCGRIVDPEAHDAEYVRTKRKSHIFVHSGCVKNWGKG